MSLNKFLPLLIIAFCFSGPLLANNLEISNLKIRSSNNQFANLQFDISWDNSWYDNINHDAAWIFIKYRTVGELVEWNHATLSSSGHSVPIHSLIQTSQDGKGVFLHRRQDGSGTISYQDLILKWDIGADGLTDVQNLDIKVFGIEMVYIPEGSYYVGDGQLEQSDIYANFEQGISGEPFLIRSENEIILGGTSTESLGNNNNHQQFRTGSGVLNGSGDDFDESNQQTLPNSFPKGFKSYYCMKYEMTQLQFVDMLNCSNTQQQQFLAGQNHFFIPNGASLQDNRYGLQFDGEIHLTTEPYLPMVYLDWTRAAAYADWSALRPMTELEFEKACRGRELPVVNEFSWGNDQIDLSHNLLLTNNSEINEEISSGYNNDGVLGNCWIESRNQRMTSLARVGIFASNPLNTGRISSGASYYGLMEMSGHAWERAVSVGNEEGRKFTGEHGDGALNNDGRANVSNWPGTQNGTTVTSNIGVGYRGGGLAFPTPNIDHNARVSSRRLASGFWNAVIQDDGIRLVRTLNP